MKFSDQFTVFFDDGDPANILFFAKHLTYAHRSLENFTRKTDIGWANWFAHPDWAVPLKHVESTYHKPLKPGKTYTTQMQVEKIGDSSVKFIIGFFEGTELCTEIKTTHVFINQKTLTKLKVPEQIRNVLENYKV